MRKTNPKCCVCKQKINIHHGGSNTTYRYYMGNYYCEKCMEKKIVC